MAAPRTIALLLRWWACVPALPLALLQANSLRKRVPRLPEAEGPRCGEARGVPGAGTITVAIVGESTAAGVGADSLDEALPGHLARSLAIQTGKNVTWTVSGGNGMTVRRVLSNFSKEQRCDVAVIVLGVNDVFRLTSIQAWRSGLCSLAGQLAEQGSQLVVFSAVPPVGRFPALPQPLRAILGVRASLLDHHLERLARDVPGAVHCEVNFPTQGRYVARDGVHPSKDGYDEWARQLATRISAEISGRR